MSKYAQQVLAIVQRLRNKAYGHRIWREFVESTGNDTSIGSIYVMLDQLEAAGWVTAYRDEATRGRDGIAKFCFEITTAGEQALIEQDQRESGGYG